MNLGANANQQHKLPQSSSFTTGYGSGGGTLQVTTSSLTSMQCGTCDTPVDCNGNNLLDLVSQQTTITEFASTPLASTHTATFDSCAGTVTRSTTLSGGAQRTVTTSLDASGRPSAIAVPGIATINLSYDPTTGKPYQVIQGTGAAQRVTTFAYNGADAGGPVSCKALRRLMQRRATRATTRTREPPA